MSTNIEVEEGEKLGDLLEEFVNLVSHPRGRALNLMTEASVTVPQAILMALVQTETDCSPSCLASRMGISPPSASQMIERLVKQELLRRTEDRADRRRKSVTVTPKATAFLGRLKTVRSEEFTEGASVLSEATRRLLTTAITQALIELRQDHAQFAHGKASIASE